MKQSVIIVHIDPAIGSTNLGDQIISEAVNFQLSSIFPDSRIINISSRDVGSWSSFIIKKADYIFFGGSNALSSNPVFGYRQLSMGFLNTFKLKNIILLGVGWWQYQEKFGYLAKQFYNRLLRDDCIHSVRDDYTKQKLMDMGFSGVLNTSCPTMWDLKGFSSNIGNSVVFTLTDYNINKQRDLLFLSKLLKKFDRVYMWPQGTYDVKYLNTFSIDIDIKRIKILAPSLNAFNEALSELPCYVGTRLHAGIRALQFKCPTFILPIDNRAIEIAKTEAITLVDFDLSSVTPGSNYHFFYNKRLEVEKFIVQF